MSAGRYVSTGFGPTSSAVGMFEPVTITSATMATRWSASRDVDTVSWPNEIEARSKGIPHYAPSGTADEWSLDDKLLSLDLRRLSKLPDKQQDSFGPILALLPGAGSKESITLSIAIRVTVETAATA